MNSVNLIGRLTRDPEMRYLEGTGTAMCRFSIAIDKGLSKDKKAEMEGQGKPTADFINIVTWAKTAEFVANYLKKGQQVGVAGRLQSGSYQNKEGQTIYTTDVNSNDITMIDWNNDKENNAGSPQIAQDFHPIENESIPF